MLKIAHLINPFNADSASDLFKAQPITFESMRIAKEQAANKVEVELISAHYAEDENMLPEGFKAVGLLEQSVLDHATFSPAIKLPLISEILHKAYHETDADYIIYTNVDIGLYPNFYERVVELINEGHDAIIVNRKRLPEVFPETNDLDSIFEMEGKSHPGFDCFIFKRELFPKMQLEKVCIGVPFIGITLSQNLFALAQKFILIDREKLTFHLGMEIFKKRAPKAYFNYNRAEFWKAMDKLKPEMSSKKLPYQNVFYPFRIIKWGLQPSIPIRLVAKLEYRRVFKGK